MNSKEDEGCQLAMMVLGLEALVLFFVLTGLVLHYGVAPAFEYFRSLISISAYWRGVINTVVFLFVAWLFIISFSVGPRGGKL